MSLEEIIHQGESIEKDCYKLEPQDSIIFITDEIKLSDNQIGFLAEKKALWEQGLAINFSTVVHPGYKGGISGLLTNIGNRDRLLHKKQKIIQLIIFQNEKNDPVFKTFPYPEENKIEQIKKLKNISMTFPTSLLDIKKIKNKIDLLSSKNLFTVFGLSGVIFVIVGVSLAIYEFLRHMVIN